MATQDFLLEIGTEEMPSAPLIHATAQIAERIEHGLAEAGLAHGEIRSASTPRRLAVSVAELATATEALDDVKRGPAASIAFDETGAPTKAALGFAKKAGVAPENLERRADKDGTEYVWAETHVDARAALDLLPEICHSAIASLDWPNYRSQRWGTEHESFVRPVRWLCALLGEEVVPVSYAGITAGNTTCGHRVLGPGEHVVARPEAYRDVLRHAGVLLNDERAELIRTSLDEIAEARPGARVEAPKTFFEEVVNLCEWPTALVGTFDEEFLQVPHEILTESMLSNQRYFPIYGADGALTREFVIISNASPEVSDTVIAGNERVVRARLDDAKFFYEEDLKVPLEDFVEKLNSVVFQEKLGTVRQKTARMEALAAEEAAELELSEEETAYVIRAAHLAKADLVSQAVVEFTNQQGVMGGYYAAAAGEPEEVSAAIREHYLPRFAGDKLPATTVGKCVSLADKIDTICGMFAIGEPPTGSSDPFAVRRAAIGTLAQLRTLPKLRLRRLVRVSLDSYARQGLSFDSDEVAREIYRYFMARLVTIAKAEDILGDTIEAVAAADIIDPTEFLSRARALDVARAERPELFDDLATAFARAAHLAQSDLGDEPDPALMGDDERTLMAASDAARDDVARALDAGKYDEALAALAKLREPIDRFFENVLVMDSDDKLRTNRLQLLNRFTEAFSNLADIGALARKK